MPIESSAQIIHSSSLEIFLIDTVEKSNDVFENTIYSGFCKESLRYLDFSVSGVVIMDCSIKKEDYMPRYNNQTEMTKSYAEVRTPRPYDTTTLN